MQRFILAIFATTAVFGCTQDELEASRMTAPPSGQGVLVSASGADVTQFTVLGELPLVKRSRLGFRHPLSTGSLLLLMWGNALTFGSTAAVMRSIWSSMVRGYRPDYGVTISQSLLVAHLLISGNGPSRRPDCILCFFESTPLPRPKLRLTLSCGDCDAPKCLGTGQCNLYCAMVWYRPMMEAVFSANAGAQPVHYRDVRVTPNVFMPAEMLYVILQRVAQTDNVSSLSVTIRNVETHGGMCRWGVCRDNLSMR